MELVFKKELEIDPEALEGLEELEPIQKQQLVIVADSFQGVTLDFAAGFLERCASELEQVFEFGMKLVHVFEAADLSKPLYDAWSDNVDAVYVFDHGTVEQAGASRCQGGFDPVDEDDEDDVALAK